MRRIDRNKIISLIGFDYQTSAAWFRVFMMFTDQPENFKIKFFKLFLG